MTKVGICNRAQRPASEGASEFKSVHSKRVPRVKVGILDHVSLRLGGSQLVVARMAALLSGKYDVDVIHSGKGYTLSGLATTFDLDLSRANERIIEDSLRSFAIPGPRSIRNYFCTRSQFDRALTEPYDLFVYSGHGAPPFSFARQGLIYCHFPFESRPTVGMQFNERWRKRHPVDRKIRSALYEWIWDRRMRGYATVLANSYFTSEWIERLWGRVAEVVYPPVAIDVQKVKKQNVIISIGRFIGSDQKTLVQQLRAFPDFLGRVSGNWSLCIIGFCNEFPEDRAYLQSLRSLAKDLPVSFLVNAERRTVLKTLAEAKLFWHTTGLREEVRTEPRHMEHFGIATVEAMMAGCVPLVPACGGSVEIVEHGVSGFHCNELDALVRHSVLLASEDSLRVRMSQRATERSNLFRPAVFDQRFGQYVLGSVRQPASSPSVA